VEKTNSMRLLDQHKIPYEVFTFSPDIHSAEGVAEVTGLPPDEVYKTLVMKGASDKAFLVIVPGDALVDPKKVAKATGEKKVAMAPQREAESVTGLQVGGISALALLHKRLPVYLDRSALGHGQILVSAGKRGINLRLRPQDLIEVVHPGIIDATE
jgi:Cys-tRNA(Pro)/Cys-tRNA(Cys) deacylase